MIIKKEFKCESIHFDLSNPTYKPDKFTNYMIHAIKIKKGETIIDVGTGSGAIAIYASKKGAKKIIGTDIFSSFEKCFLDNCKLNNVKNCKFIATSLLDNVKEKTDVVIANLPQTPFNKKIDLSKYGGYDGTLNICKVIEQSSKLLKTNGRLYINGASLSNPYKIIQCFEKNNFKFKLISKHKDYFTKKRTENWKKGLFNHFKNLKQKGIGKFYKDRKKFYYYFYIYEAIKK